MSQTKTHSQSIFVLTLAVYLGLVLAGGASPALAQAAMAKGFDLKVEQEIKDDLDKKPDDEKAIDGLADDLDHYLGDVEDLLASLKELYLAGKFAPVHETFSVAESSGLLCDVPQTGGQVRYATFTTRIDNDSLEPEIRLLRNRLYSYSWDSDCLSGSEGKSLADTEIEISYDSASLKTSFSVKKGSSQKAAQLLNAYKLAYKSYQPDEEKPAVKLLFENTKIISENDQVFIVTNLPRAGLDALLAVK
jgi:hypothetical protein